MSNKYFILLIAAPLFVFFGWLFYDSKTDTQTRQQPGERRDLLTDDAAGGSADIQYLFKFADPVYSHALDTSQIEALAKTSGGENFHVYGLTTANYKMDTLYEVNGHKNWFRSGYAMWVDDLQVEFSYTTIDVYVTDAYTEGSCEYQATLDHENQHVAIHKRIYAEYQKKLQDAVADAAKEIPLSSRPITVGSWDEGKDQVGKMVSAVVDPVFDQFKSELETEQGKIDTPESYRGLNQRCQNW